MPQREVWEQVARSGAWFASLPDELAAALLDRAETVQLGQGQRLFARGDPPDGVYCILRGLIRFTGTDKDGRELLLAVLDAPQWFGEIAVFDEAARTHDAWAQDACELLRVPQGALLSLLAQTPDHWRHLGRLLTQKLRMTFEGIEELSLLPPTRRVAGRLLVMAGNYGSWEARSRRSLNVSQEQLGSMMSLSRQTINQSLRELEALGAIQRNRASIEILELEKLRDAKDG